MIFQKFRTGAVVFYVHWATILISDGTAQTTNPDISLITDFRTFTHNDTAMPAEKGNANLDLHEIELAIQGYLNPYSRADIFIAKHGVEGEVEIEEANATFLRGLPLGLNVKVGKYLVDFGKLNTLHPHAYHFVERPLLQTVFFGEDGFNDIGINISFLLPTGSVYSQVSFNLLKGDFASTQHHHGEETTHETAEEENLKQPPGYSGRISAHAQVSDYANLEFGLSGATGIYDLHEKLRLYYGGVDVKYKWVPSRYTSLTLQGEALVSHRKIEAGTDSDHGEAFQTVNTFGFFSYANLQFRRRWNAGVMGDWTQSPDSRDEKYRAVSFFGGFAPMEETSVIRLLLRREKHPDEKAFNVALVQVIFSLGPHKAHIF